jgi:SOUL heme-binding protein
MEGGLYAAIRFAGDGTKLRDQKVKDLRDLMARDGLRPVGGDAAQEPLLLQYNDPSVKTPFRRNEVIAALERGSFELWET